MEKASTNTSQVRILKIISALKGHTLTGLSNSEIAAAIKDSKTNVSRALDVMITEGFAIKHDSGRFSLSSKVASIAMLTMMEFDQAENKINEMKQRMFAGAQK